MISTLLAAPGGVFFGVCLALVGVLLALEVITALFGGNPADALIPDFGLHLDMPDADVGGMEHLLGWLHVGRVPIVILLAVLLCAIGGGGLAIQSLWFGFFNGFLTAWVVVPATIFLGLFATHWVGGVLEKILPHDETSAVARSGFIGHLATITEGTARPGLPAEARLVDAHGTVHHMLVEPLGEGEFQPGTEVLLMEMREATFLALHAANTITPVPPTPASTTDGDLT